MAGLKTVPGIQFIRFSQMLLLKGLCNLFSFRHSIDNRRFFINLEYTTGDQINENIISFHKSL